MGPGRAIPDSGTAAREPAARCFTEAQPACGPPVQRRTDRRTAPVEVRSFDVPRLGSDRAHPRHASENFWAAEPLQSQIWRRVPFAVAPDGESMHRPVVGLDIEPSALATQFW